ncbi:hypothetical protein KDU71_17250 [Carboxylicivirga sediminis]|uniref:Outer membrane protein beta-barrel domain-containing protein n=1 Tax=Carboxylicivirga sediminis TaxID=2006564 RepID=A0A941F849_9BACT|nr:hypothetical protein [Carboxylicivirga sediminis]MBR8537319.1 hypothetical protein [Carboxylicivirga sediminis]
MNRIKTVFALVIFISISMLAMAQDSAESKKVPLKDKLFTGGSVGLTFGDYTNVMISPVVGARLNPKVYAGLGIEYQYTKDKRYNPALTYNQFGGRIFAQYNIVPNLFAHGELAGYSMERYTTLSKKERNFVPFIYFGGGYRQMISERSFVSVQVLFDVLQHKYSPYKAWEPIFSIGFGVGI